jgi:hypothetical protein
MSWAWQTMDPATRIKTAKIAAAGETLAFIVQTL